MFSNAAESDHSLFIFSNPSFYKDSLSLNQIGQVLLFNFVDKPNIYLHLLISYGRTISHYDILLFFF